MESSVVQGSNTDEMDLTEDSHWQARRVELGVAQATSVRPIQETQTLHKHAYSLNHIKELDANDGGFARIFARNPTHS